MAGDESFRTLLERVRQGDEGAAATIVERYEPALKRMIRVRMVDRRLRKLHGESDIFQSVMGSFFVRMALGQYDLKDPEDLLKLLAVMVRNKVADKARRKDMVRDSEPLEGDVVAAVASGDLSPSRAVELRQLVEAARAMLTPDLLELVRLREEGLEWADIATRVGDNAEALRKRLARGIDAVAVRLGLDSP